MSDREDRVVKPVIKGQLATYEVNGGFARRPVPEDGLLIEMKNTTIFVPAKEVAAAMEYLCRRTPARRAEPQFGR